MIQFPNSNLRSTSIPLAGSSTNQADAGNKSIVKFINIDGTPQAVKGTWGRDSLFHTFHKGVEIHFYPADVFDDEVHSLAQQKANPAWRADENAPISPPGARRHSAASVAALVLLQMGKNDAELEKLPAASSTIQQEPPTILDLIALANDSRVGEGTELIGVEKPGLDGRTHIVLHSDDDLSKYLDSESQLANDISAGKLKGEEQLALLREIVERYKPKAESDGAVLLERATTELSQDLGRFSNGHEFLSLLMEAGKDLRNAGRRQANTQLYETLQNTLKKYNIPSGTDLHCLINKAICTLRDNAGEPVSAQQVQKWIRNIGEAIHRNQHVLNQNLSAVAKAPREAARMPKDCMMHWISELDSAVKQTTDSEQRSTCAHHLREAKRRWLHQDVTFDATRKYFEEEKEKLQQAGLHQLAALAAGLGSKIPDEKHDDFTVNKDDLKFKAALNDNIYGRVFDSLVADGLVKDPTPGMLDAAKGMGAWVSKILFPSDDPDDDDYDLTKKIHIPMRQEQHARSWFPLVEHEDFQQFMSTRNVVHMVEALTAYLNTETEHLAGLDCIAITHLMMRVIIDRPHKERPDWHLASNRQYAQLKTHRARIKNLKDVSTAMRTQARTLYNRGTVDESGHENLLAEVNSFKTIARAAAPRAKNAGVTLLHQPAAVTDVRMWAGIQPSIQVRPNFTHLDEAEQGLVQWTRKALAQYRDYLQASEIENIEAALTELSEAIEGADKDVIEAKEGTLINLTVKLGETARRNAGNQTEKSEPVGTSAMNKLPEAMQTSLSHNEVFGTDLSGTTLLILHAIADANSKGARINVRDALINIGVFANYDGGHSFSECVRAAYFVDGENEGKLNLGLKLGSGRFEDFVFDYGWLTSGDESEHMERIFEQVFDKTIAYFRKHSIYASPAEGTANLLEG